MRDTRWQGTASLTCSPAAPPGQPHASGHASSEVGDSVAPAGRPLCPRRGDLVWPEALVDVACLLQIALQIGQHHLAQSAIQPREDEVTLAAKGKLSFHSVGLHAWQVILLKVSLEAL